MAKKISISSGGGSGMAYHQRQAGAVEGASAAWQRWRAAMKSGISIMASLAKYQRNRHQRRRHRLNVAAAALSGIWHQRQPWRGIISVGGNISRHRGINAGVAHRWRHGWRSAAAAMAAITKNKAASKRGEYRQRGVNGTSDVAAAHGIIE